MTDELSKYVGFVEADAGVTVKAKDKEHAEEKLEDVVQTGHLGPPKVRGVERF